MKRKNRLLLHSLAFLMLDCSVVVAQPNSHWKKIGQLPVDDKGVTSFAVDGYFWSPERGMVYACTNLSDTSFVYYTSDSGKIWKRSIALGSGWLPDDFWHEGGKILMINDSVGWLAERKFSNGTPGGILKTSDSGVEWTQVSNSWNTDDIYFDYKGLVRSSAGSSISKLSDSIWVTTEDTGAIPSSTASLGIGKSFGISTNAGNSWSYEYWNPGWVPYCGIPIQDCYGVYASSAWHSIIAAPEDGPSSAVISSDTGKVWNLCPTSWAGGWAPTGDIEGGRKAVYAQSRVEKLFDDEPFLGVERTIDTGKTWKNVGGPSNYRDSRFCVIDCNGAEVVAFGVDGSIWLTTDGGDGTLHPENAHPKFTSYPASARATLCQDTVGGLRIFNDHCDSILVLSMMLLDSNSLAVTSGTFGFDSLRKTPFGMRGGTEDSIGFHWNPLGRITRDTSFTLHLDVRYFSQSNDSVMDTILPITLAATFSGGNYALSPQSIDMGTVSTCASPDTTIILSNLGCVPLLIDSSSLTGLGFVLLDSIPSVIEPGDSLAVHVRFAPTSGDNYGRLSLYLNNQGVHSPRYVDLTGRGVQGMGALAMQNTSLAAGSFSFCDGDTTLTDTLRNTGCDTLVISNIRFGGDTSFSFVSSPGDSLLLPGASEVFEFQFAPRVKGSHSATLSFHSRNIVNDPGHDTTLSLFGIGLDGMTALSADTTPRDFGALYECEERDTTIWLANPGCDTLRVDSAAFSNASYSPDTAFPIFILPDSSAPVKVHLTGSANMDGAVTFYSDANTGPGTETVPLRASLLHPATVRLVVSPSDSAAGGITVTCYAMLEGQIPSGLISALHFDITHNDDLLSFLNASGAGLSIVNTSPKSGIITQSFTLSPIPNSDTIGMLRFQVYLTDSTSTPIALSNISFTTSRDLPLDCIASIEDNGAQFTYVYRCGDRILQNFMLKGQMPFRIERIAPNPATNEIRISGRGLDSPNLGINVFDLLGRQKTVMSVTTPSGVVIDASSLPTGTYFLRVSAGRDVETRGVTIVK